MRLDLAGGETFRGQRDHHRIDTVQSTLSFLDGLWFEHAIPVPGCVDLDRADLCDHFFRTGPVTRVLTVTTLGAVLVVAKVFVPLNFKTSLQNLFR